MTIIGIGTDLCSIHRINKVLNKYGERFCLRIFTKHERIQHINTTDSKRIASFYAKRFAAKEATAKALGTGIIGTIISWKDIEVQNHASGKPNIVLYGAAKKLLEEQLCCKYKNTNIFVSLSDTNEYAQAVVIIEALS